MNDSRLPPGWLIVAEAGHGVEAAMIEDALRAEGIEVAVLEASGAPGAWLTGAEPYWAPKSIAVPVDDEERALEILDDLPEVVEDEGDDAEALADAPPPFDTGGPAVMSGLRRVAWVLAAVMLAGILWTQCPGSA